VTEDADGTCFLQLKSSGPESPESEAGALGPPTNLGLPQLKQAACKGWGDSRAQVGKDSLLESAVDDCPDDLISRVSLAASKAGIRVEKRDTTEGRKGADVRCPPLYHSAAEIAQLHARRDGTPVFGPATYDQRKEDGNKTITLFLLVPPGSGSTGLLSMLATSPEVTTLCAHETWACEATWLLINDGLMTRADRWDADKPSDWGRALEVMETVWDPKKKIRIEKSPPNINKIAEITEHFKGRTDEVAFISMAHSSCFKSQSSVTTEYDENGDNVYQNMKTMLVNGFGVLEAGNFKHLHIRYEDLVRYPYSQAERILDFLPVLKRLDPDKNNLQTFQGDTKRLEGDRTESVVGYTLGHGPSATALNM
jgi:hypothetical protein